MGDGPLIKWRNIVNFTGAADKAVNSALAVRDTVARLIADVYAGTLSPRIAASLAPLLNLQLRAIETADLEQRLVNVEKQIAAREAKEADQGNRNAERLTSGRGDQ